MSEPTPSPEPATSPDPPPRCIYLNCKSMQVWGEDFVNDPEYQAGMVEFWCNQTFRGQGPDGGDTSMPLCSNPERPCYREY